MPRRAPHRGGRPPAALSAEAGYTGSRAGPRRSCGRRSRRRPGRRHGGDWVFLCPGPPVPLWDPVCGAGRAPAPCACRCWKPSPTPGHCPRSWRMVTRCATTPPSTPGPRLVSPPRPTAARADAQLLLVQRSTAGSPSATPTITLSRSPLTSRRPFTSISWSKPDGCCAAPSRRVARRWAGIYSEPDRQRTGSFTGGRNSCPGSRWSAAREAWG